MRKHLALVVEHEDADRVGGVMFYDSRKATMEKNEPSQIHKYDEDAGEFYVAGTEVGVGYVDFEDEQAYKDWPLEELQAKLQEIDREWLEQADITEVVEG